MKPPRCALLAILPCLLVTLTAAGWAGSMTISNTTTDLFTKETATRVVDGLPITYPVDEADVVERLLPSLAGFRAARRSQAKAEAEALIQQFSRPELRERYRAVLPAVLGLEPAELKDFDRDYEAMLPRLTLYFRQWEKWSGDLSHLHLWNRDTGAGFIKDDRVIFPEISYSGKASAPAERVAPAYTKQAIGFDLRHGVKGDDPVAGLERFRLDLPLFYIPGTGAIELATPQIDLIERLPATLRGLALALVMPAEQALAGDLLERTIRSHFFTAQAAATPRGALLLRSLARQHLLHFLRELGKDEDELDPVVPRLMHFEVPKDDAARQELGRALETLEPFSEDAVFASPAVAEAARGLATYVLLDCAQAEASDDRMLFHLLRETQRVPPGGFASVAGFRQAVEAAYPGEFAKSLVKGRAKFLDDLRNYLAKETPAKPAPLAAPELPDRQTQVVDGLTIVSPASLGKATARMAPEWAALLARARAEMEQRYPRTPIPPVAITDETLAMLRAQGLEVTRPQADSFALQVAVMANAGQLVKRAFDGKTVQVWFKSDLKALLLQGRTVPGFSYEPARDKVNFRLEVGFRGKFKLDAAHPQPLTGERVLESFIGGPPPEYPVVLKDDSIAGMTDLEAQVARVREEDVVLRSMMEAAGTISPEQLGIKEIPFHRSLLSPAQSLFLSVHELVEDAIMRRIIASPDRRWFCDGTANFLAQRACEGQFGGAAEAEKVFASLYNAAILGQRSRDVDLLGWAAVENQAVAGKQEEQLTHAHYYFATKVIMAATEGRGDGFLKSWIAKIRETPWNRTNGATILAAYEELTGKSLRRVIWSTVEAPVVGP